MDRRTNSELRSLPKWYRLDDKMASKVCRDGNAALVKLSPKGGMALIDLTEKGRALWIVRDRPQRQEPRLREDRVIQTVEFLPKPRAGNGKTIVRIGRFKPKHAPKAAK